VLSDDPLWGALEEYTQWPTVPQIFSNGEFIGGCDIVTELYERGELQKLIEKTS
jgi:monothiol glutaredoxin